MSHSDEEFEVVDIRGSNNFNWLRNVIGNVSRETAMKQAGVGAVSGMLAGFLFVRVGKVAAATMGTTILLIQLAQHQGYIQINWDRVREHTEQAERQIRDTANIHYPGLIRNVRNFFQENLFLAVGFGGGFLIGMAF